MARSRLIVRWMIGYDWFGSSLLAGLGSGDVLTGLITRRLGFVTWVLTMSGRARWLFRTNRAQSRFILHTEDRQNCLELGVGGRDLGIRCCSCDGRNAKQEKERDERTWRHVGLGGLATSLEKGLGKGVGKEGKHSRCDDCRLGERN